MKRRGILEQDNKQITRSWKHIKKEVYEISRGRGRLVQLSVRKEQIHQYEYDE